MLRPTLVALCLVLAFGCDNTSHSRDGDTDMDAGPGGGTDAGPGGEMDAGPGGDTDAGPGGTDAGPGATDAGPPGDAGDVMCGAAPMPAPFDCNTSDPDVTFGAPITAPAMTWTFIEFPGARCANGSSTGIGVNLNPASDRVMIFLEGGGACFDFISCIGAANLGGYDAGNFASSAGGNLTRGIFDRTDTNNPVRDWNMIYVPYCTGDVHSGSNPMGTGGREQVGHQNMREYLARIVPTFPTATRVLLTGRSAGGLGALVNHELVQQSFDCVRVDTFSDSGGPLPDMYLRPCLQSLVRGLWDLAPAIPDTCVQCSCQPDGGGLSNVFPYLSARFPSSNIGFLSYTEDGTMRGFYGYGYSGGCNSPANMPAADFTAGLNGIRASVSGSSNVRTFYLNGGSHTVLGNPLGSISAGGTNLGSWLSQMIDDTPAWSDVGP